MTRPWLLSAALLLVLGTPGLAGASERYALVVTGASGGAEYAGRFDRWREALVGTLVDRFAYPRDHVIVLAEEPGPGVRHATGAEVRAALGDLAGRATAEDVVLVLLIGHGSVFEGDDAKFNLVGPDLSIDEWATIVKPIAGRLVFVNTTAGSSPFLRRLAGVNRIVITATNSTAQRFTTVFPGFFVEAFEGRGADADKDGRVSVWEAFEYASARVRAWFRDQGQPAIERALLDDTGTGLGREASEPGAEGSAARSTYLEADGRAGTDF